MKDQLSGVIIPNEHLASGTDEPWSAESAERTMSGHDENVEALSYRCM